MSKYTNERYAFVGSLAVSFISPIYIEVLTGVKLERQVLVWDIFLHLPQDYKLATRYRINFLYITYCIAR